MKSCSWCKVELTAENCSKGSGQCRACRKIYRRKYYEQAPNVETDRYKKWSKENAERRAEYKRIWNQTHPRTEEQKRRHAESISRAYFKRKYGEFAEAAKVKAQLAEEVRAHFPAERAYNKRKYAQRIAKQAKRGSDSRCPLGNDSSTEGGDNGA